VDQAGVPPYDELVFLASEDTVDEKGDAIRGFLGAVARGLADLRRDPENSVEALLRANRELDPKLQRAVVKVNLAENLHTPPRGRPFGYQDPREWAAFGKFMRDAGLIDEGAEGAFTNGLLPGGGL
jgi:putative hydroxymethylpyrimidine transport system substrate-binding protein